jgi:hypothetical protein
MAKPLCQCGITSISRVVCIGGDPVTNAQSRARFMYRGNIDLSGKLNSVAFQADIRYVHPLFS